MAQGIIDMLGQAFFFERLWGRHIATDCQSTCHDFSITKNFKKQGKMDRRNPNCLHCFQGRSQNPALQRRKLQVQGMGEPETYDVPANMRFIITRHWTTLFAGLELELVARVV